VSVGTVMIPVMMPAGERQRHDAATATVASSSIDAQTDTRPSGSVADFAESTL
jgi:hypothetical protein